MNPTLTDVHTNAALTNMSVAYAQKAQSFMAWQAAPTVRVSKQANVFKVFNKGDFFRDEARLRAPATEASVASFRISDSVYNCRRQSIAFDLPQEVDKNADEVINMERSAVRFVTEKLMIRRERDFASSFLATSRWANDWAGVASGPTGNQVLQWNLDSADPIANIDDAKLRILQSTGYLPNKMVIGYPVYLALRNHPDIIERVKFVQNIGPNGTVKVDEAALANLFGLDRLFISQAVVNTAVEGATDAVSLVVGKVAFLYYAPDDAMIDHPSAMYTFSWDYLQPNEYGISIKDYVIEAIESVRYEGSIYLDHRITASDLGFFWNTIVA